MGGDNFQEFSDQLLEIGNGTYPYADHVQTLIRLADNVCTHVASRNQLISKVFPDIQSQVGDVTWFSQRAILTPLNDTVNQINEQMLAMIPGRERYYYSRDSVRDEAEAVRFPVEYLNSLNPSGFAPHRLTLKKGCPIMLLRNLDPPKLCNGTRLMIKELHNHIIEAIIMIGPYAGTVVNIPRIPQTTEDTVFTLRRVQFPVRLAFAMTINKSQGQTLQLAGLDLESQCFTHGQLYVACSRVGNPSNLFVYSPNGLTRNVVYHLALRD